MRTARRHLVGWPGPAQAAAEAGDGRAVVRLEFDGPAEQEVEAALVVALGDREHPGLAEAAAVRRREAQAAGEVAPGAVEVARRVVAAGHAEEEEGTRAGAVDPAGRDEVAARRAVLAALQQQFAQGRMGLLALGGGQAGQGGEAALVSVAGRTW